MTDSFELVSVCDPSVEHLKEAEDKFGVKGYSNYYDMLNNEKFDLVVIASPTIFHKERLLSIPSNIRTIASRRIFFLSAFLL